MEAALFIDDATKRFGRHVAVDGLSLSVEPGAFLGLLGRNGAGKSTTIKMCTALLAPTSGRIQVLGLDIGRDDLEVKRRIGVMPEDMGLLDRLTGDQYLHFVGRMHGLAEPVISSRRDELCHALDLAPAPRTLICDYSYGMKKKMALCAALLHGPQLLFLDEPFEGLDPVASRTVKDMLGRLRQRGLTVVLTSHVLEIVEATCSHVAVLDGGRLRGAFRLDEMRASAGGERLEDVVLPLLGAPRVADLSWM